MEVIRGAGGAKEFVSTLPVVAVGRKSFLAKNQQHIVNSVSLFLGTRSSFENRGGRSFNHNLSVQSFGKSNCRVSCVGKQRDGCVTDCHRKDRPHTRHTHTPSSPIHCIYNSFSCVDLTYVRLLEFQCCDLHNNNLMLNLVLQLCNNPKQN